MRARLPLALLLGACVALFGVLVARSLGLNPVIFADEWYYSKMARLLPLDEAFVPSFLYLWLFRASNACGDGFLDCVRAANALLFVGAAPFLYLTARQVAGPRLAAAVAVLSLLAPANLYTALFMPEATYWFGFAVLAWVALASAGAGANPMRHGLACGLVLGLMSLVKVHAVFLLPALCLYLVAAHAQRSGRRAAILGALLAAVLALAIRFGLGFLLAGRNALDLFGSFYGIVSDATAGQSKLALLRPAFINFRGHLMTVAVLFALPLALVARLVFSRAAREEADPAALRLHGFTLLMLASGAGMTVAYTASLVKYGPAEALRLHVRYYSFVFPLLLTIAAGAIGRRADARSRTAPMLVAALVGSVVLLGAVKLPTYALGTIDSPEAVALRLGQWPGWLVVALDLLVLALWARGSKLAAPLFLFAAVPLVALLGALEDTRYLRQVAVDWPADKAGKFAHRYVPPAERGRMTVVADDEGLVMRAQFHVDDKDANGLMLAPDAALEPYEMPAHNRWLLVVGRHALPEAVTPAAATPDYTLYRLPDRLRRVAYARFAEPFGNGLLAGAEGLSAPYPWGRQSRGRQVVLHFNQPLPGQASVVVKARTVDVLAPVTLTMRVGNQAAPFRLFFSLKEITLPFTTDGRRRSLAIDVPPGAGLVLQDIEIAVPAMIRE